MGGKMLTIYNLYQYLQFLCAQMSRGFVRVFILKWKKWYLKSIKKLFSPQSWYLHGYYNLFVRIKLIHMSCEGQVGSIKGISAARSQSFAFLCLFPFIDLF